MKSSSAWGWIKQKDRHFVRSAYLFTLNLTSQLPDFLEHFLALLVCFAFYSVELGQFGGVLSRRFVPSCGKDGCVRAWLQSDEFSSRMTYGLP